MITVIVRCRKHNRVLDDCELDSEDDEHTIRVSACELCIDEAEKDGKDSRDDEVDALRVQSERLSEEIESLQEQLGNAE